MDITDSRALQARYAETYRDHGGQHLLRKFEQYEIVRSIRDETDAGGRKINTWTGVPVGRIQGWLYQNSEPRGYEWFQRADDLGLFDLSWEGEQFRGLNELVAWILSGGIVSADGWVPTFSVETAHLDVIEAAIERAGAPGYEHVETPGEGDTRSVRITDAGSIYGRLLVALGAPRGNKHESEQQFGLPYYLGPAPEDVRRRFAEIYLLNRGVIEAAKSAVTIAEERPDAYLEALAGLFRSLTTADVWRDAGGRVYLAQSGLEDFDVPKKWNRGGAT